MAPRRCSADGGGAARRRPLLVAVLAGCRPAAGGWRSECDVEGVEMEVTFHGARPVEESGAGACRVAFLTHEDILASEPGETFNDPDIIFTDSLRAVRFAGRRGRAHFLENVSAMAFPPDLDGVMLRKTELLSVLLPPPEKWGDLAHAIHEQAQALVPGHIYIDDGTWETHDSAFRRYRFCLIADAANHTISEAFLRSVAFHTVGLFNGYVEVGAMVFNGIGDFVETPFSLPETMQTVQKHNEHLGALWHYQRILQDQLQYRYNRPFEERLLSQACTLCRLKAGAPEAGPPPLAFVGIYSARANFAKRRAVRETWGRVLTEVYGLRYTFFLGEASPGGSRDELRMRREVEEHRDIVFLEASEGYRMNSRKGLLFLRWIAMHSEAEFLLKVDDDVYFRPAPLLEQMRERPPAQYAWGYWDYISPVPREPGHHFHNAEEDFPFEVFAPYPRGVVRVLSMDVVRLLAEAGREGRLRTIFGDDPCIGVHLRQLLFDPEEPLPSLTLDDFDNKVFAMEPSCHPNLWSKMTNRSWAVHHVSPEQIECMWRVDLRDGYYAEQPGGIRHNEETPLNEFPSLCECATDPSFEDRRDMDELREQTNAVLFSD